MKKKWSMLAVMAVFGCVNSVGVASLRMKHRTVSLITGIFLLKEQR
ncbi:hypothetical protein [uncultured Veillonella sp.]|jgi:hypothetical protein|nr:hypothetical protein [uncultured Veillonella sp.]